MRAMVEEHAQIAMDMGRGARPQARQLVAEMEERGIRFMDKAGREWQPRSYAEMALRTATADASNMANLGVASQLGSPGVRVFDGGPGDVDEPCLIANGQHWSLEWANAHRLEHPNCRRSFAALPSTWQGTLDRGGEETASDFDPFGDDVQVDETGIAFVLRDDLTEAELKALKEARPSVTDVMTMGGNDYHFARAAATVDEFVEDAGVETLAAKLEDVGDIGEMPTHSAAAAARLDVFEGANRNESIEHGLLITPDGEVILETAGDATGIRWDAATRVYDMPDNILTHNHPMDLPFSESDIQMMTNNRLAEIRAVTPKRRYSMRWSGFPDSDASRKMKKVMPDILKEEKAKYESAVLSGEVTPEEGTRIMWDNTWRRTAPEIGLEYASEEW